MLDAPKLTLAQWARQKGLVLSDAVDAHIHAGLRSAPRTKTFRRWYFAELTRLQDLRDQTLEMYRAAVERGEVVNPDSNRLERLVRTASGHPDNPSVQAARRILEGMGYQEGGSGSVLPGPQLPAAAATHLVSGLPEN
ncbi:hypothetical protein D3C71_18550 [compost metagenome]